MTFPEDQQRRWQAQQPVKPPNYWAGLLLNMFIPGSGFTYINNWKWHLGWIAILTVLFILSMALMAVTGSSLLGLLSTLGWVAQLVHYHMTYQRAAQRHFRPVLDNGLKVGLILGIFIFGFFSVGIISAVLIPNLLGARIKSEKAAERAYASSVFTQVMLDQAERKPLTEQCPLTKVPQRDLTVTKCRVGIGDPANPTLDITFSSGRSVHLPRE